MGWTEADQKRHEAYEAAGRTAFPTHGYAEGMMLRDYFAAHAPAEVPEWFQHVPPARDYTPMPKWMDWPEEHHRALRAWLSDGCYDLPDELSAFQEQARQHREDKRFWDARNQAARFIQWRWRYAEMMLEARKATS